MGMLQANTRNSKTGVQQRNILKEKTKPHSQFFTQQYMQVMFCTRKLKVPIKFGRWRFCFKKKKTLEN